MEKNWRYTSERIHAFGNPSRGDAFGRLRYTRRCRTGHGWIPRHARISARTRNASDGMVPERWVYNVLPEDELKVSRLNFSSHARCRHMTVGQRAMAVAVGGCE